MQQLQSEPASSDGQPRTVAPSTDCLNKLATPTPVILGLIVHFSSSNANGKSLRPIAPRDTGSTSSPKEEEEEEEPPSLGNSSSGKKSREPSKPAKAEGGGNGSGPSDAELKRSINEAAAAEDNEDKEDLLGQHGLYLELPEGGGFACALCEPGSGSRSFGHKAEALRHLLRAHARARAYECARCPLSFDSTAELEEHAASPHPRMKQEDGQRVECARCEHRCADARLLGLHVLRRHARQFGYVCGRCARCFRTWPAKNAHECAAYLESLTCKSCPSSFTSRRLLGKHQREKHEPPMSLDEAKQPRKAPRPPAAGGARPPAKRLWPSGSAAQETGHPCKRCGKRLSSKDHLRLHERTHTGERPYPCPECGRAFALLTTMKVHSLAHRGIKPYLCRICWLRYSQRSALMTHWRSKHANLPPPPPIEIHHYFDEYGNLLDDAEFIED